jgi:5-methylcytosine-specific restriction protein A
LPNRAQFPCRHPGCASLLPRPGFCPAHRPEAVRSGFAALEARKTDAARAFYSSKRWTDASLRHRNKEPLCRRCRAAGRIVSAQMVHHNPPVEELVAKGLSPFDERFLESLCNDCHLTELRKKKNK